MSEVQLSLTDAERELLVGMLNAALGDKRVEVRRTEFSSQMHKQLENEEALLRSLLEKLNPAES